MQIPGYLRGVFCGAVFVRVGVGAARDFVEGRDHSEVLGRVRDQHGKRSDEERGHAAPTFALTVFFFVRTL